MLIRVMFYILYIKTIFYLGQMSFNSDTIVVIKHRLKLRDLQTIHLQSSLLVPYCVRFLYFYSRKFWFTIAHIFERKSLHLYISYLNAKTASIAQRLVYSMV